MSAVNPIEAAAVPSLVAMLQAMKTFVGNLGNDPLQVPVKLPGALQVFIGTVEMQLPSLAASEFSAVQSGLNSKIDGWISELQKKA